MANLKPPPSEPNVRIVARRQSSAGGEDAGRPRATSCKEGEVGILLSGMG